ncbi:MAG: HD domain-containing protein [Clostridiales Family XIII bacterium]|nr:HD domain-containing protein [Clostridiales Family XIII bacterium]
MGEYRILYIGDVSEERDVLTRVLSADGDFAWAASVHEASIKSLRGAPDIILVSRTADGASADENGERLLEYKRLAPVSVIVIKPEGADGAYDLNDRIVDVIEAPFTEEEILRSLRVHLNIARRDRALREQVDTLQQGLITSISEMVECRDEDTGGHIARTSRYVTLLSMELLESGVYGDRLTVEDVERMGRAAPLHDIGKVGVSDAILLKPGPLTDEEFAAMKKHTLIGEVMIERLMRDMPSQKYLSVAREIAITHHEKYDGSGYPYGISGEDIPISGRVMAVADVYDALVADRVYRKAMSQEKAYNIITESGGSHFDPHVVEAFKDVFDMMSAIAVNANERNKT